jgi:BirA family biotin operon repressor/biotin-[acetyl-CoA-carboxylase] ligase
MAQPAFTRQWPVAQFSELDSTNEEARRRASGGDFGPQWLIAETQTAGRGRLGRKWESPPGNLFATALFEAPWPLADCARVCFSAALAVIDAALASGVEGAWLRLKWPNDVLASDAKLAGILIESGQTAGKNWLAAGFGVNIAHAPPAPGRETACISGLPGGGGVTAADFLNKLDAAFRARLASLAVEGFETTRDAWLARAAHLGRLVEASPPAGRLAGVMRGIDTDGSLIMELANGDYHHVRAGEVSVLN